MAVGYGGKGRKNMSEEEKKMHAEADLRTLVEAEEIKRDSARLKAAKKCAREQKKSLETITA